MANDQEHLPTEEKRHILAPSFLSPVRSGRAARRTVLCYFQLFLLELPTGSGYLVRPLELGSRLNKTDRIRSG